MKKIRAFLCSCVLSVLVFSSVNYAQNNIPQMTDLVTGQSFRFRSDVLGEERVIQISLPLGYNNSENRYPLIIVLDGEAHFQYTAGLVQYMATLGYPQMIVAGIPNTVRNRDYTARKIADVPASGGGDNFLKFLETEFLPYIDKNYRTHPYRIIIGHSLTGVFSLYTMLTRPDMFNGFICASPWVISDDNYIVGYAEEKLKGLKTLNKRLYCTVGSLEQEDLQTTMGAFNEVLAASAPSGLQREYKLLEGHDHGSLVPATIFDGLRFIYRDWQVTDGVMNKGLDAILEHYRKLSETFGYSVTAPEFIMNIAGYNFLRQGKHEDAIAVFKKNTELYPRSPNTYDSLGEAYENGGQLALALENYEKAFHMGDALKDRNTNIFRANYERVQNRIGKN